MNIISDEAGGTHVLNLKLTTHVIAQPPGGQIIRVSPGSKPKSLWRETQNTVNDEPDAKLPSSRDSRVISMKGPEGQVQLTFCVSGEFPVLELSLL